MASGVHNANMTRQQPPVDTTALTSSTLPNPFRSDAVRGRLGVLLMLSGVGLALATQFAITTDSGFDRIGLGFLAGVFLYVIGAAIAPKTDGRPLNLSRRAELVALGCILGLAAFLRIWQVWDFPPGLWYDEVFYGLDAIDILENDHFQVWSADINGRPMLFMYILAGIFKVFGVSEMTMRSLPIAIGVVTVGAFYLLARQLLGQVPALMATFLLAVSRWQITFSRITWEASMMPLMVILSMFFLLKALETRRWYYYAAAGAAVGTGLYTYLAFRLVPVALVIIVGYIAWREWPLVRRSLPGLVAAAVVSVIVFLPLGQYAYTHQELFFHRANQVDIRGEIWDGRELDLLDPPWHTIGEVAEGLDLDPVWENARKVANMFNVHGDRNGRHNIPGEPMLGEVSAALLVIGAAVSLAAWRNWRLGSLLLLAGLMGVPSIFTLTVENPSAIRVLGIVPPVFLLAGLAGKQLLESGSAWFGRWWFVAPVLAVLLATSAGINYYDFFERQSKDPIVYGDFGPRFSIVANRVAAEADDHEIILSSSFRSESMLLLAPDAGAQDFAAGRDVPFRRVPENDVLFILDPQDAEAIRALELYHPEGQSEEVLDPFGKPIYMTFSLPRDAAVASQGLRNQIFDGEDTSKPPTATETLLVPSIDWAQREPPAEAPFTMVWEGTLFVDSYTPHTLEVVSPGHVRLELDGSLLGEGDELISVETAEPLAIGPHALRVTLGVDSATGISELRWLRPGEVQASVVAAEALLQGDVGSRGFLARYFPGGAVESTPALLARQIVIGPVPRIPPPYSAELFSQLTIDETGEYRFALVSNQETLIFLDGELLLDRGPSGGSRVEQTILLTSGPHDMVIRYVDPNGQAYWSLEWAPPGQDWSTPPLDVFHMPEGGVTALPAKPVLGSLTLDASWGEDGRLLPGIEKPIGVALGPEGELYLLDGDGDVRVFDPNGNPLRNWDSGLGEPSDIAVDADGNVYVLGADDSLRRFRPDGTLDQEAQRAYATARGVAVAPDGTVYAANPSLSAIVVQEPSGATTTVQPPAAPDGKLFLQPTDVVWAPEGFLFAVTVEQPSIWKIMPSGGYLLHWPFFEGLSLSGPHLAWDNGLLLATDPQGSRVLAYDADGRLLASGHLPATAGAEPPKPIGIAAADGVLWTADSVTGKVFRFSIDIEAEAPP